MADQGERGPAIKVVFFDIDGTLLPHGGSVPASARRAIAVLRERGVRVVLATGRHPIELDEAGLDGMVFDGYAAANGQMCLDGDRRLFAGYPIPRHGVEALVRLAEAGELIWFFGEAESYASRDGALLHELASATTGIVPEVRAYGGEPVYQAVAFAGEADEPALAAQLPGCRLQRWGALGVDIIAEDGGKVEGMKAFLERFGCTREECMAFGDQHNDLDMLAFAGIGVAMGDGAPAVREAADYVTSAAADDGVARALRHFGLV